MDQLSSLIQELEACQGVADVERLKKAVLIWKSETDAILYLEFPNFTPEVDEFNRRWRMPMVGNSVKNGLMRKLRNARTDLRFVLRSEDPVEVKPMVEEVPELVITDYGKALLGL